jgi:hypothetical protein
VTVPIVVHECRPSGNPRRASYCDCGRRLDEPSDLSARNPAKEREFLRGAEKIAGLDIGWAERVEERLLRMERSKGTDSYRTLGFWRCVAETDEEDQDLGGWPLMAYLLSFDEFADDDERGLEARILLQHIAAHGVQVAGLIERLRELRR